MQFSSGFSGSYFTGTPQTTLVPHKYDVGINGRGYMIDRKMLAGGQFSLISTIRATRAQSDGSQEPGEQSLNPDDLWRRSQTTWHLGAGQDYLDRDDSSRKRFRTSKGVDIWTEGQIGLLPDTTEALNASGTNLKLMPAGARLYAVDGTALKYTTDLTNWTTVTGTSGSSITGVASDGLNVWVTDGSDVYKTTTAGSTASSWSTEDADVLGYVKGRLMFSDGPELGYFSDMATPTATSLFTHAASSFVWVGFAAGPGNIYAAGYAGDKSLIYRIAITREATSLDAPTVAGELPDGEIVYSIGSYLGYILLGTSEGARFCRLDGQGNLVVGELIPTDYPVRCFEGQGRFIWFGWSNYDGTSTGLGRMDLRNFSDLDALKPAYASDLMLTSTADVLDVCTFLDQRVFAVSQDGFYTEDTDLVASGTLDCGSLDFGISDKKIPLFIDASFVSDFLGTLKVYYALDGDDTFTLAGTVTTAGATNRTFDLTESRQDQVEIRFTLDRDGSTTTSGPTVTRYTVRAQPVPNLRRKIVLPLILHDRVETNARVFDKLNVANELQTLEGWRITKQVVTLQIGHESYAAVLDDFDHFASQQTADLSHWQGTCVAQFKTV